MEGGSKKRKSVPYTNLPTSGFGKIVMKKYVELQESAGPVVNCKPIKIPVSVALLFYLWGYELVLTGKMISFFSRESGILEKNI